MRTSFRLFTYIFSVIVAFAVISLVLFPDAEDWNGILPEEDITTGQKLFNRVYASASIFSTIGLGQVSPKSTGAKALVLLEMLIAATGIMRLLAARHENT